MCLGIPMQIVELKENSALVDVQGVKREVSTVLVADEKLQQGDWLMIHIGYAIGKINENDARETLSLLNEISQFQETGQRS